MKPVDVLYCSVSAAKEYGIEAAIILNKIEGIVQHHLDHAQVNPYYIRDGRAWAMFTYIGLSRATGHVLSPRQCERYISRLRNAGAILVGFYGEGRSHKACWYSLPSATVIPPESGDNRPDSYHQKRGITPNQNRGIDRPKAGYSIPPKSGDDTLSKEKCNTLTQHTPNTADEDDGGCVSEKEFREKLALYIDPDAASCLPPPSQVDPLTERLPAFARFWAQFAEISDGHPGPKDDAGAVWNREVPPGSENLVLAALEGYAKNPKRLDEERRGLTPMKAAKWLREWSDWAPKTPVHPQPRKEYRAEPNGTVRVQEATGQAWRDATPEEDAEARREWAQHWVRAGAA